jgi:hypothetical protein
MPDPAPQPEPEAQEETPAAEMTEADKLRSDLPEIPPLDTEDLTATERRVVLPKATLPTQPDAAEQVKDDLKEDDLKTEPRKPPGTTPPTVRDVNDSLSTEPHDSSSETPPPESAPSEYPTEDASRLPKLKIDSSKVRTKPLAGQDADEMDTEPDAADKHKPDIKINTSRLRGTEANDEAEDSEEDDE